MFDLAIFELSLVGVAEPNVPRRERILVRPTQTVSLAEFGILVAWRVPDGTLIPLADYFYWFGAFTISPPSWICLYTGAGTFSETKLESGDRVLNLYWGREKTIFSSPNFVPLLVRMSGIQPGQLLSAPAPRLAQEGLPDR